MAATFSCVGTTRVQTFILIFLAPELLRPRVCAGVPGAAAKLRRFQIACGKWPPARGSGRQAVGIRKPKQTGHGSQFHGPVRFFVLISLRFGGCGHCVGGSKFFALAASNIFSALVWTFRDAINFSSAGKLAVSLIPGVEGNENPSKFAAEVLPKPPKPE